MFDILRAHRRRAAALGAATALGVLTACVATTPPQLAAVPPIPFGDARVWFYRDFLPDDSPTEPKVAMNGGYVGFAAPGVSFYRDVPAGAYHITVDSYGKDLYQSQDVYLPAGQQQYVKIQSLPSWEEIHTYVTRGTFYVALMPPQLAAFEMAQTNYRGGS